MSENWVVMINRNKEKIQFKEAVETKWKRKILCSIMEVDPFFHFYSNGDVPDGGRN